MFRGSEPQKVSPEHYQNTLGKIPLQEEQAWPAPAIPTLSWESNGTHLPAMLLSTSVLLPVQNLQAVALVFHPKRAGFDA